MNKKEFIKPNLRKIITAIGLIIIFMFIVSFIKVIFTPTGCNTICTEGYKLEIDGQCQCIPFAEAEEIINKRIFYRNLSFVLSTILIVIISYLLSCLINKIKIKKDKN